MKDYRFSVDGIRFSVDNLLLQRGSDTVSAWRCSETKQSQATVLAWKHLLCLSDDRHPNRYRFSVISGTTGAGLQLPFQRGPEQLDSESSRFLEAHGFVSIVATV